MSTCRPRRSLLHTRRRRCNEPTAQPSPTCRTDRVPAHTPTAPIIAVTECPTKITSVNSGRQIARPSDQWSSQRTAPGLAREPGRYVQPWRREVCVTPCPRAARRHRHIAEWMDSQRRDRRPRRAGVEGCICRHPRRGARADRGRPCSRDLHRFEWDTSPPRTERADDGGGRKCGHSQSVQGRVEDPRDHGTGDDLRPRGHQVLHDTRE